MKNEFCGEWVVPDVIKLMLLLLKSNKWQSNRPPNMLNARQEWFRDKVEEGFDRRMVIKEQTTKDLFVPRMLIRCK